MNVIEKYPEICKSAFIEHLTELQQKELFAILDEHFVKKKDCVLSFKDKCLTKEAIANHNKIVLVHYKQKVKDAIDDFESKLRNINKSWTFEDLSHLKKELMKK